METVLVINAGSSSIKISLFKVTPSDELTLALRGQVEGIATAQPRLSLKRSDGTTLADSTVHAGEAVDHRGAMAVFAGALSGLPERATVDAVGHRVVHGGVMHSKPVVVDDDVLRSLESLVSLAPLHQPHNLAAIRAAAERLPGVPQIACFDTAFHRAHPKIADVYALPWSLYERGVRRYGFHGLSYEYVARVLPSEIASGRVVIAHLGSGASMCALRAGQSMDSTMGFTAVDGLPMGTRTGQLDPGILLYLLEHGTSPKELEALLYRKSGLLGLSGVSNDMRELLASYDARAEFAVDYFVYAVTKQLGALAATLGGLDAIVFTAGIGERSPVIRARVCQAAAWLGIELDENANAGHGPRISRPGSRVSAWVIPTNEELMIARHTVAALAGRTIRAETR